MAAPWVGWSEIRNDAWPDVDALRKRRLQGRAGDRRRPARHEGRDPPTSARSMIQAGPTATGLFYFAGHGAQTSGVNYLLPVGALITPEGDLTRTPSRRPACWRRWRRSEHGPRSQATPPQRADPAGQPHGARLRPDGDGRGSYIAYSAGPGEVAEDGKGYAQRLLLLAALAAEIGRKGQPIETTFPPGPPLAVLDASKARTPGNPFFVPGRRFQVHAPTPPVGDDGRRRVRSRVPRGHRARAGRRGSGPGPADPARP